MPPVEIASRVEYDRVGNVIRSVDPRGIAHTVQVNSLNQVVSSRSAADTSGLHLSEPDRGLVAFGYESVLIYDANNNVVETRREETPGFQSLLLAGTMPG